MFQSYEQTGSLLSGNKRLSRFMSVAGLLCCIIASLILIPGAGAQTGAPAFTIDSTRRNFGDVFIGEELEQVFTVRNTGQKPLELSEKSVTTGSIPPSSRDLIKTVSFNRDLYAGTRLLPVAASARRAAPS